MSCSRRPLALLRRWTIGLAMIALVGCTDSTTVEQPQADLPIAELPKTALLTTSMRQLPVPGWTASVRQLGLPPDSGVLPLVNVGDRSIFLGITEEDWWLFGVDVGDGTRFLSPVRIGSANNADIDCYVNGPPMVLCVWNSRDLEVPPAVWTIDTASGTVRFDGLTTLFVRSRQDQPSLAQVGDRAVAAIPGKGVYGVGQRGELTWFVPGDGALPTQQLDRVLDTTLPAMAVQGGGEGADIVFSAVNGNVVKPSLPQDVQFGKAMVYPGGFSYQYTPASDFTEDRVAFYDSSGNLLSQPMTEGTLENGSPDLPMVLTARQEVVSTLTGERLLELPRTLPSSTTRLIGSRLFISDGPGEDWRQFDLRTGAEGKPCPGDSLGSSFIASDGEVVVATGDSTAAQGVDLASCQTLWTLPERPGEVVRVWRVNNTLVQRADDRLFSLVAPA